MGLFNTLFLLPFIPILHVLGIETFRLPLKKDEWIICGINMVITLSSDYLYVLSMLKTTPLGEFSFPGSGNEANWLRSGDDRVVANDSVCNGG